MTGGFNRRRGFSERQGSNPGAKKATAFTTVIRGGGVGAGLILAWLYWSNSGHVIDNSGVTSITGRISGQSEDVGRQSTTTPGGGADLEGWQPAAAPFQGTSDSWPLTAEDLAAAEEAYAESQDTSGADAYAAMETPPDEATASSDPSDDEADTEAQLLPISGWVLNQLGEPVAHMEVRASARRLARDRRGTGDGQAAVLADETGYFAFSDLPEGEYLLETEATDEYESARTTVRTGASSAVLRVRGDSGTLVTIHGVVTDENGQPILGARVAPTDEARATTTDSVGFYRIVLTVDEKNRDRTIRFTKPGYHDRLLDVQQATLRGLREWQLDARLQGKGNGVPVDGTVVGAGGAPVAGARIKLSSRRLGRSHHSTSAADGSFYIDDVDTGDDYRLWVRPRADYQDHVERGLRVGDGGAFLPVTLDPLGTGSLQGRMVNAASEPIPRFTLWMWNGGAGGNRSLAVTSDSSGGFTVEDVPAGEVTFNSRGEPRFNVGGIALEPGKTITANVVLDWGHEELTGRVMGSAGDPLPGAAVRLSWSDQAEGVISRSERRTVADGDGYFLFTELGPGPHTVSVTAAGHRAARREAMPGEEVLIVLQETAS